MGIPAAVCFVFCREINLSVNDQNCPPVVVSFLRYDDHINDCETVIGLGCAIYSSNPYLSIGCERGLCLIAGSLTALKCLRRWWVESNTQEAVNHRFQNPSRLQARVTSGYVVATLGNRNQEHLYWQRLIQRQSRPFTATVSTDSAELVMMSSPAQDLTSGISLPGSDFVSLSTPGWT